MAMYSSDDDTYSTPSPDSIVNRSRSRYRSRSRSPAPRASWNHRSRDARYGAKCHRSVRRDTRDGSRRDASTDRKPVRIPITETRSRKHESPASRSTEVRKICADEQSKKTKLTTPCLKQRLSRALSSDVIVPKQGTQPVVATKKDSRAYANGQVSLTGPRASSPIGFLERIRRAIGHLSRGVNLVKESPPRCARTLTWWGGFATVFKRSD